MQLEALKLFISLIDCQNYSLAADLNYISQSTMTKKIQKLEDDMGVKLLERTTRSIKLSPAGEIFFRYAKNIVSEMSAMEHEIQKLISGSSNNLRIVSFPVMHLYDLAGIIRSFREAHPAVSIQFIEGGKDVVTGMVEENSVDLAIVRSIFFDRERYDIVPLLYDELVVLCSPSHPFASRESVSLREIEKQNLIMLKGGVDDYRDGLKRMGLSLNVDRFFALCQNADSIIKLILDMNAVSLMMGDMASKLKAQSGLTIVSITEHPIYELGILSRGDSANAFCKDFIQIAESSFRKYNVARQEEA